MPAIINKIKIKEEAGLIQAVVTTDIKCIVLASINFEDASTSIQKKSFYAGTEHLFSFWVPVGEYSLDFNVVDSLVSENMQLFAWGQTNTNFEYYKNIQFLNLD